MWTTVGPASVGGKLEAVIDIFTLRLASNLVCGDRSRGGDFSFPAWVGLCVCFACFVGFLILQVVIITRS